MSRQFKVVDYDKLMAVGEASAADLKWFSPDDAPLRLSGFVFRKPGGAMRRLPKDPELPEAVNGLAGHTAGAQLAFKTDSRILRLKIKLQYRHPMDHMCLTGSQGFDLYLGAPGERRFARVTRMKPGKNTFDIDLLTGLEPRTREFLIHLPLYSGIAGLKLGLSTDAKVEPPTAWRDPRPIVYYGTSITQGGCASRPGMTDSNILSRRWNLPVLNFGFSGSGKGEAAVIRRLADIADPRMLLLDYTANAGCAGIKATLGEAIDIWRAAHPETPVVLMTQIPLIYETLDSVKKSGESHRLRLEAAEFQRAEVERRRAAGDRHIHLVDVANGESADVWGEYTVDGVHLTDLGFMKKANIIAPQLEKILNV